jgi:hypothetical protein
VQASLLYGTKAHVATHPFSPFRSFILDRLTEVDSLLESPLEKFDLSQLAPRACQSANAR